MRYYVYMLINVNNKKLFSYVGYTKNIEKRLIQHNNSNGAKYTKGRKWILCYKETYLSKSRAMSREYKLKRDRKFRNFLKEKFKKNNSNYRILKNNLR